MGTGIHPACPGSAGAAHQRQREGREHGGAETLEGGQDQMAPLLGGGDWGGCGGVKAMAEREGGGLREAAEGV